LNVALFWPPGITIDAGTVKPTLLELKAIVTGFVLLPVIPTEQTVDPLLAIVDALQLRPLSCIPCADTVSAMDAVCVCPFAVAVIVA